MTLERTYERFQTTRWTEIRALAVDGEDRRRDALELLIGRYWPPVYAHLRSQGKSRDAAAELTQAFFAEVVLDRGLFDKAQQSRGRLRTLLLTALKRFGIDQHRRGTARRTDVTIPLDQLHIEDTRLGPTSASAGDAALHAIEKPFERRWAMSMFEEALRRCEAHFRDTGRAGHWELFETRVLRPAITQNEARPLAELAEPLGFKSPALAAAAVQVVKRRATALLREVVAETVDDGEDVDEELAEVRRYLEM